MHSFRRVALLLLLPVVSSAGQGQALAEHGSDMAMTPVKIEGTFGSAAEDLDSAELRSLYDEPGADHVWQVPRASFRGSESDETFSDSTLESPPPPWSEPRPRPLPRTGAQHGPYGYAGASQKQGDPGDEEEASNHGAVVIFVILFRLAGAYIYKRLVTENRPNSLLGFRDTLPVDLSLEEQPHQFRHGLCDWYEDWETCAYACCCSIPRLADTFAAAELIDYWKSVFLCIITYVLAYSATATLSSGGNSWMVDWLLIAMFGAYHRQALRKKLGSPAAATANRQLEDFFVWACCHPCAIAQEARQVDQVQGVVVGCCFRVQSLQDGDAEMAFMAEQRPGPSQSSGQQVYTAADGIDGGGDADQSAE
mmetsp:Transcript_60522/g.131130  ORF Transcript_60522/g.131130 Transcript_60522/m.131130 type:complete len:366 (+) Transcript_60522:52-1149(+)